MLQLAGNLQAVLATFFELRKRALGKDRTCALLLVKHLRLGYVNHFMNQQCRRSSSCRMESLQALYQGSLEGLRFPLQKDVCCNMFPAQAPSVHVNCQWYACSGCKPAAVLKASIWQALLDFDHVATSHALELAQLLEPLGALLLIDMLLARPPGQHLPSPCHLVPLRCCL